MITIISSPDYFDFHPNGAKPSPPNHHTVPLSEAKAPLRSKTVVCGSQGAKGVYFGTMVVWYTTINCPPNPRDPRVAPYMYSVGDAEYQGDSEKWGAQIQNDGLHQYIGQKVKPQISQPF